MNCINFVVPMNPCPCGYYPDRNRCRCTEVQVRKYTGKVSGPILDRIDLCAQMEAVDVASLQDGNRAESSAAILGRVLAARERQRERYAGSSCRANADVQAADMNRYCALGPKEKRCMDKLYHSMQLSARAYHRILRVARTIADLAGAEKIEEEHLMEAVYYRPSQEYRR